MVVDIKIGKHTKISHSISGNRPHIKSFASLILLNNYYRYLDIDYISELDELKKYLKFRKEYLSNQLEEKGHLECTYCHRKDLIIGYTDYKYSNLNNKIKNLATIDHIHPKSKGGFVYDIKNCTVACKKCNRDKGDKILD